jgi:hypothetical protein
MTITATKIVTTRAALRNTATHTYADIDDAMAAICRVYPDAVARVKDGVMTVYEPASAAALDEDIAAVGMQIATLHYAY